MKKLVLLKPYNHNIFYKDKIFRLNNGHNAFYKLDVFLGKHGYSVHTIDYRNAFARDIYLYADMPYPWEIKRWIEILFYKNAKKVLVVLESPLVNPFNQWRFLWSRFDSVLTWNSNFKTMTHTHILIPQLHSSVNISKKKKKFIVLINANKKIPLLLRLLSLPFQNLYTKRKETIKVLSRILPRDFDLFGKGWNNFLCNKGEIKAGSKLDVLSQYRFSICFENSIADGYITEKIFDCFKAEVVPVYLGAPDISAYIPENCYIDFRSFDSYTSLVEHLQDMTQQEYNAIQMNIKNFLKSRTYKAWSQKEFFNTILKEITDVQRQI